MRTNGQTQANNRNNDDVGLVPVELVTYAVIASVATGGIMYFVLDWYKNK